jgi:hypothetical protein
MFDDLTPGDGKEPEDIFEQTDKTAPQVQSPTAPTPAPAQVPVEQAPPAQPPAMARGFEPKESLIENTPASGSKVKVIVLIIAIIIVIAGVFFLSMKILSSRTQSTPEAPVELNLVPDSVAEEEVVNEPVVEEVEEAPEVKSKADTDKDGLTDEEEAEAGTSILSADTDGDGLFDLEEVKTWKTNPLNPDTDGDGFLDGAEVDAGYNPNGEGLLREAPSNSG